MRVEIDVGSSSDESLEATIDAKRKERVNSMNVRPETRISSAEEAYQFLAR